MNFYYAIIPIPGYWGDDIYEQYVYFQSEKSIIILDDVRKAVEKLNERNKSGLYSGAWEDCKKSILNAKSLLILKETMEQISTSTTISLRVGEVEKECYITLFRLSFEMV